MKIKKIKKAFILTEAAKPFSSSGNTRKTAFTLAEVLITLGIIGVVAAMTLPTLIQKQNEKATVSMLKKIYSILSQAYTMAVTKNGPVDGWGMQTGNNQGENPLIIYEKIKPELKLSKDCGLDADCLGYNNLYYKYLDGSGQTASDFGIISVFPKGILADGTYFWIEINFPECNGRMGTEKKFTSYCGAISVDINGLKKPNTMGKDFFYFHITKDGIIPPGMDGMENIDFPKVDFTKGCLENGGSCTAWVIYNENMDYLHCDDLSWDGKHKCSK